MIVFNLDIQKTLHCYRHIICYLLSSPYILILINALTHFFLQKKRGGEVCVGQRWHTTLQLRCRIITKLRIATNFIKGSRSPLYTISTGGGWALSRKGHQCVFCTLPVLTTEVSSCLIHWCNVVNKTVWGKIVLITSSHMHNQVWLKTNILENMSATLGFQDWCSSSSCSYQLWLCTCFI